MEKNEKGYPCFRASKIVGAVPTFNEGTVGGVTDEWQGNGCTGNNGGTGGGDTNGCTGNNGGSGACGHDHSCGGDGSCLDEMNIAYVYSPDQKFRMLYSAADALAHGTLFEELYKPKEVYGRE